MKTLEQLESEIRGLVVQQIHMLMNAHNISVMELNGKPLRKIAVDIIEPTKTKAAPAKKRGRKGHKPAFKGPQPPKYQDPKTGATWSGFGRAPAWIAKARNRDRFLMAQEVTGLTEAA